MRMHVLVEKGKRKKKSRNDLIQMRKNFREENFWETITRVITRGKSHRYLLFFMHFPRFMHVLYLFVIIKKCNMKTAAKIKKFVLYIII